MEQRKCRACEVVKPLDEFANAGTVKGVKYYRHLCVPCYSESKKPRKEKIRAAFYEIKKSCECEECGEDDFRVLDFDHKDPGQKTFNIGDGIRKGFTLDTIKEEMAKCRVLCANCHRRKTWDERNYEIRV